MRSRLQTANYFLGNDGPPQGPLVDKPGIDTNAEPPINLNEVVLSPAGTVFYGRRAADNTGSIWSINLDGCGETYITSGARPRMSRDGRWLAFLRDGNPFANTGNLYARNLVTGAETLLVNNTNSIVLYDWDGTGTNLVFDYNCVFYQVNLAGTVTPITTKPICNAFAPAINPVNGSVAFFDLSPGAAGMLLTARASPHSCASIIASPERAGPNGLPMAGSSCLRTAHPAFPSMAEWTCGSSMRMERV
jgi:hypothetical protein